MSEADGRAERFSRRLNLAPLSQWEAGVSRPASACGPAAMAALADYWAGLALPGSGAAESAPARINHMYERYGGRPWGMSAGGLVRGLRRYWKRHAPEGARVFLAVFRDFERYREEIDAGRPVAVKFDRWSALRWRGDYAFDYHWTVGIGYEVEGKNRFLLLHDNGGRKRSGEAVPGRERRIAYEANRPVLTMVSLRIDTPENRGV
ncbi:hypothetical protein F4V43_13930 [Paenibacillus spiritus]|uniref:Peptidase C39-like domain-containing protein n=1 Tax=Paenibacillus spiritus TaxID=2496557 RepID=A0A5J5G224_9BACL|nr:MULTISPECIES: C39 family peptidase [Paenibacillus]KAA9000945.1 hypothetical protein F4V43_13930 [Paenibacillus spiritus]